MFSARIAALGALAREQFQEGRLKESLQNYDQLCRLCPREPEAWHMLGVVYAALGESEKAVQCARKTVELAPKVISGYRNLGHFLMQLGRADEAEGYFREAVSLSGGAPADRGNLGAALARLNRHEEAIACFEAALTQVPDDAELHFNLGATWHALGRWPAAVDQYERASRLVPEEPRYVRAFAVALQANGEDTRALEAWSSYLQRYPGDADALCAVGAIYFRHGQFTAAANFYTQAVEAAPDLLQPRMDLGLTQFELGNADRALECFERMLVLDPTHPQARFKRAVALELCGQLERALAEYEKIGAGDHGLDIVGARAGILEKRGDFKSARDLLEPALSNGTLGVRSLDVYARLCRHFGNCDRAIELIEARLSSPDIDEDGQRHLHFRIGELYDRLERYDEAFAHFDAGNRLKNSRYSAEQDIQYVDHLIEVLSAEVFAAIPSAEPDVAPTPIFIVGMPRSGTTLVEQIVASHPDVHAGDELPFITRIANTTRKCAGQTLGYPDYLPHLSRNDCQEMAHRYLDELRRLAPAARFVTDKMPHNFAFLGLIHRLFPNAPIIHCVRDPVDVCLSCYFHDFAGLHNYAYNLADLGQHFLQYRRMLAHFRDVLAVPMFDMQYECLVDDPEAGSRALIEYCGLPWDARCLRFYESERKSNTASYDQIRQPIYKRSSHRWCNYQGHLEPLLHALRPLQQPRSA